MASLKDIALALGVNISTVSRALNDSKEISETTKQVIREKARELHYMPNLAAQTLTGKSTRSIGLIIPEVKSDYYAQITNFVEAEIRRRGYTLIIGITDFNFDLEVDCLNTLSSRRVDGILFMGGRNKALKNPLQRISNYYKIPVVLMNMNPFTEDTDLDITNVDNFSGIREAIFHLAQTGRSRIAYIGDTLASIGRLASFKTSVTEATGNPPDENYIIVGNTRFEQGGYQLMKEMMTRRPLPDAVFAAYDDMAIGVLKVLYEAGISVPEDIAVTGYDNIRYAEYLWQPLTTIHSPLEEFCSKSVEFLMDRIEGTVKDTPRRVTFPTRLIIRETT